VNHRSAPAVLVTALGSLLALTACAVVTPTSGPAPQSAAPHGHVDGATEVQEPQLRLVSLDTSGALSAFDPASEESVDLGTLDDTAMLSTDGRYAFSSTLDGRLTIVDIGAWTVPHGDHLHYYLADPRTVGELDEGAGAGAARVASSSAVTSAYFPGSGTGVVLDADALGEGRLTELSRIEGAPHDGALMPLGTHVVGSVASSQGPDGDGMPRASAVQAYTSDGVAVGDEQDCAELQGAAITRVGVIFGCADGALLATEAEGTIAFDRIPYPETTSVGDRATSFALRTGRPTVAAVSGERGAWLLDTRAGTWTLLPSDVALLRATAVGDSDGTVVAVDAEGRIVVLGPGRVAASSEPVLAGDIVGGSLADGITLEVDSSRAYVNSPSTGLVHEIDYADDARIARSLDVSGDASFLVETGR
jgi:hypothetical protein